MDKRERKNSSEKGTVLFADTNNSNDSSDFEAYHIFSAHIIQSEHETENNEYDMIYDTGANTIIVNSEKLVFDVKKLKDFSVSGVGGKSEYERAGIFPCFGRAIVANNCAVNIMSSHVAEGKFKVEHNVGINFIIHVNEDVTLVFSKRESGLYTCDMSQHMAALERLHCQDLAAYTTTAGHYLPLNNTQRLPLSRWPLDNTA